ncbi:MAG: hypothetical protein AAF206_24550, partial [Bacteroidota bacterium]
FTVCRNYLNMSYRRQRREGQITSLDEGIIQLPDFSSDPEFQVEWVLMKERLETLLGDDFRLKFERYIKSLKPRDYAQMILMLHLRYHLPLSKEKIQKWFPACTPGQAEKLVTLSRVQAEIVNVDKRFQTFSRIMGSLHQDRKPQNPEALRKWFDRKRDLFLQYVFDIPADRLQQFGRLERNYLHDFFENLLHQCELN